MRSSTLSLNLALAHFANVENATLTGISAFSIHGSAINNLLTGNSAANVINGGLGNDVVAGGLGNDTLTGGAGIDQFVFNTLPNSATNRDVITDFVVINDTVRLENAIFTTLTATGGLSGAAFWSSSTGLAHDSQRPHHL